MTELKRARQLSLGRGGRLFILDGEFLRILSEWELDRLRGGEIVRKLMVAAMDRSGSDCYLVVELLTRAEVESALSKHDVREGLAQIQERIADLKLDIPEVSEMVQSFQSQFRTKKLL